MISMVKVLSPSRNALALPNAANLSRHGGNVSTPAMQLPTQRMSTHPCTGLWPLLANPPIIIGGKANHNVWCQLNVVPTAAMYRVRCGQAFRPTRL